MDHRRVQAQDTAAVELTLHDVMREMQDLRAQLTAQQQQPLGQDRLL